MNDNRKDNNMADIKDISTEFEYKGKTYRLVFNLNVMEAIQDKYGTIENWGKLTDGEGGEPNAKAVIFGFREMINEGIDIMNEETGNDVKPLTLKQTGRLITEIGIAEATKKLNKTVIDSTQSAEKNA